MFFVWSTADLMGEDFHGLDAKAFDAASRDDRHELIVLTQNRELARRDPRFEPLWTEEFQTAGLGYFAHCFVLHADSAASARARVRVTD